MAVKRPSQIHLDAVAIHAKGRTEQAIFERPSRLIEISLLVCTIGAAVDRFSAAIHELFDRVFVPGLGEMRIIVGSIQDKLHIRANRRQAERKRVLRRIELLALVFGAVEEYVHLLNRIVRDERGHDFTYHDILVELRVGPQVVVVEIGEPAEVVLAVHG